MEKYNKWQSTPRKGPVYSTGAPKKKNRKKKKLGSY